MKNRLKLIIAVVLTVLLLASTLVFAFASDSVTVSFYDGEKLVADVSVASGAVPAAPDADEIVLIDGVGYRFLGWTDTVGGTEPIELSAVTEDTTLYAVRTPAEFKVEKANGDVVWYAPGETTLTALISGADAEDYITLCSDSDIAGTEAVRCGKSFTLDLNGNTLTTTYYIMPISGAQIEICNGTVSVTEQTLIGTLGTTSNGSEVIKLTNLVVKKDTTTNTFLLDLQVGSAILDNVTVAENTWNVPSNTNYFMRAGYRTKQVSQAVNFTIKNSSISLPDIHFITASGRSAETNGYNLTIDLDNTSVTVTDTGNSIVNMAPAETAAANCKLNVNIYNNSVIDAGGFSAEVAFNISSSVASENVNVWADYGVKFARYPKLTVGTLKLGDKEKGGAMLDVPGGNDYGIVTDLWAEDYEPVTDYAYSFCVVGDTQMAVEYDPNNFYKLYDWILANKDSKNIKYVFGMGDLTNHSKDKEWTLAINQVSRLNGILDYSLVRGNHDTTDTYTAKINELNPTYKTTLNGFYSEDALENSYDIFTVGDTNFLHITLDYHPTDDAVAWAKSVIASYPDHKVIISTHSYLAGDGTLDTRDEGGATNSGADLWNELVSQYENIFLVLCGHVGGNDIRALQLTGLNGNTVTQIMANGQGLDYRNGAMGMVAMLYFSEDGKEVSVEYISTNYEKYLGEDYQFTLQLEKTVELNPSESDLYAVVNPDGTVKYYGADTTFSNLVKSADVLDGAKITFFGNVVLDTGFKVEKNITVDLNGHAFSNVSGAKLQGGKKTVNIINGTINITGGTFVYIDTAYGASIFNIKNVTIVNNCAENESQKGFADLRSGTLNFDKVTITAEGWNNVGYVFISAGYRTNAVSSNINVNVKNSSLVFGTASSNFVGYTGHASETNGWTGNLTVTNSTVTTGGYFVQAKPSANAAQNCGFNVTVDGRSAVNVANMFNVDAAVPAANISVTFALGAKVSSIPKIAGVNISYAGGVLTLATVADTVYTVANASDAACKLVDANDNVTAYIIENVFTSELVALAQSANCEIVLVNDMTASGTSILTRGSIAIDLNGKVLEMGNIYFATTATGGTTGAVSIRNGTVECSKNVFYSYSGSATETQFIANDVKFVALTSNTLFDHRIGVLSLTDCEIEFRTNLSTNEYNVFTLGYVANNKSAVKVIMNNTDVIADGSSTRNIFKLYGGRPVTIEATNCDFAVDASAYVISASKSDRYNTATADSITFTGCTFKGENIINNQYDTDGKITVTAINVIAPTCVAQGYTSTVNMLTGEETKSNYTDKVACTNKAEFEGASIKIGDTLALIYYVDICDCDDIANYTVRFTMNGVVSVAEYCEFDGDKVFIFDDIPPQCMGDLIDAELIKGEAVIDSKEDYSIKQNAEYLLETYSSNASLVNLVNDLLNYGAAAQLYKNYKTDALVTDTDTTEDVKPESTDMTLSESTNANVGITAAGVWFDYNNRIYVKYNAANGTNVTVLVNGVAVESEAEGNGFIAYTGAISARNFEDVYVIELVVENETVQTLTYSINSYAYAKWDATNVNMQKLARALYAYGVSADNYVPSND